MDRRTHPANAHAACRSLAGRIAHDNFVDPEQRAICIPVVDLCDAPNGKRDRQLLFGDQVRQIDVRDGWAFVQSCYDSYVGYIPVEALGPEFEYSHIVTAQKTHIYEAPDFKSRDIGWLPMAAQIQCDEQSGKFLRCNAGWVPMQHMAARTERPKDPVAVAMCLWGVPYLWGGNSVQGIDCSGLVQLSMKLCGLTAPGDSDLQQSLGSAVTGTPQHGDLLFWRGHVAWVLDRENILHANAATMSVTIENRTDAISRIEAQGDGLLVAHRRLPALR